MLDFAERTGLAPEGVPRRYLWTDAFALANFLGLARATRDERFAKLALALISQVHHVLGQYRPDDPRKGWISGLAGAEAESHPTKGGLRIGKEFSERKPRDLFDGQLEWSRDGQYFHYLTRWIHALDLASRHFRDPLLNVWASELAEASHEAFSYGPGRPGERRVFWKMGTDLERPLVPAMGHHDPIDGLVTCTEVDATATRFLASRDPSLGKAIVDFRNMFGPHDLPTADELGIGSLLTDAYHLARLVALGMSNDVVLLDTLLAAGLEGLYVLSQRRDFCGPPSQRLAFRELGLAIGLHAAELVEAEVDAAPARFSRLVLTRFKGLARYEFLAGEIRAFWLRPENRQDATWLEHRDINEVMLATSLVPAGYLLDAEDEARLGSNGHLSYWAT